MGRFDGHAIVIDLSSYEKGQTLKPYVDAGATDFIFRMWYQGQYVYGDWRNQEDAAYRGWYDEAKALGARVGGYALYCAGLDDQDYERSEVMLSGIGEVMSNGYKPDYLMIDDEINKWYQSGRNVTATAPNQVKGLRILIDKCWKRFQLVTGWYSRITYLQANPGYVTEYTTWLDNVNKTQKTIPTWLAAYKYYRQAVNMTSLTEFISALPYPTSTFENSYLNLGNQQWELWQLAGDVSTQFGKCDISVSRLPVKEYHALFNLTDGVTPPPPPPVDPPVNADLSEKLAALALRVAELERWRRS